VIGSRGTDIVDGEWTATLKGGGKVVMSFELSSTAAWYVIQTKPKQEAETSRRLGDLGLECLLPKVLDYRTWNGRAVTIEKPLFPSYLFVKLILVYHYYQVKWTKGLARFVGWGDKPVPIADEIVDIIRNRMDEGGRVRMGLDLKPGEQVRIKSGPLKDFIGIFDGTISPRRRVRILLQLVGSQVSVNLPTSQVESIR
jgi:transcriptional antiterminator RfaH